MGELVVACISLLVSISLAIFYFKDRRQAKYAIESQYTSELLSWHEKVIFLLSRMKHNINSNILDKTNDDLSILSALIDQGRFYFPNVETIDGFGSGNPPAFRGYRNLALDFLVAAYNLVKNGASSSNAKDLELLQKHFTSIVYEVVNPRDKLELIRSMTDRYFIKDQSFEDFLEKKQCTILHHIWL